MANNKKIIGLLCILLIAIIACSCTKQQTVNQSINNFDSFEFAVYEIAKKYDVSVCAYDFFPYEVQMLYRSYRLEINEHETIEILVSNSAETSTGVESFDIEYTKENVKSYNEYNIKLFVELSNSISGRALTDDDVWEFINAAEDQYPVTKYGRRKASDELISKIRFEDFFENWCLFYALRADNTETLTFSGLTKNSVY